MLDRGEPKRSSEETPASQALAAYSSPLLPRLASQDIHKYGGAVSGA
jgi:hypothetical protein